MITNERFAELKNHIKEGKTKQEVLNVFRNKESLEENCVLCYYIEDQLMPMARQNGQDFVEFFEETIYLLKKCIWERLCVDSEVYLLFDATTSEVMSREGFIYLAYTKEYEKQGKCGYAKIESKDNIYSTVIKMKAKGVVLTDGPNFIVPIVLRDIL